MRRGKLALKVAALAMLGTLAVSPISVRAEGLGGIDAGVKEVAPTESGENRAGVGEASEAEPGGASEAVNEGAGTSVENTVLGVVENKVDTEVPDEEMQGAELYHNISGIKEWWEDLGESTEIYDGLVENSTKITAEDAKADDTVKVEYSKSFFEADDTNGTSYAKEYKEELEKVKNKDLLLYGDLSIIKKEGETPDSTAEKPYEAEKGSYILKAEYDLSATGKALEEVHKYINYGAFEITKEKANKADSSLLKGGFRSSFTMGSDLTGSFYIPKDEEDAKKNYSLSATDGNKLLYRINYGKSVFTKNKVSLVMDMDVSDTDFSREPSLFNLKEMMKNSAKKLALWMRGVKLEKASGNKRETENEGEKITVAQGSITNTLVGYLHANTNHEEQSEDYYSDMHGGTGEKMSFYTGSRFKWGAVQSEAGRDSVVGKESDKLALTVQFTNMEKKNLPNENSDPVRPNNGGNGGGGNGSAYRTLIIPAGSPVASPVSDTNGNPGEVLGVNRSDSHTEDTSALEEKKGEVLGESRSSEATLSARAKVSTGDKNFTALWASLFGLSVAAFAGFVLLQRKKEVKKKFH